MAKDFAAKTYVIPPINDFVVGETWTMYPPPIGPVGPSRSWCTPTMYNESIETHTTWSEGHRGPPFLTGGPFASYLTKSSFGKVVGRSTYQAKYAPLRYYIGGFYCATRFSALDSALNRAQFGLTQQLGYGDPTPYGPTAWSRYRPGRSSASLAVMLAEARDIPGMLKKTAKGFHDAWKANQGLYSKLSSKKIADHWLNTQFGWLPFISDLRKLLRTQQRISRMIDQIRRENGKWIRRSGTVTASKDVTCIGSSETETLMRPILDTPFYSPSSPLRTGSYRMDLTSSEDVWFTGRFRYWIPNIQQPEWQRVLLGHLSGAFPNPAVIWELTPWSWLIDWVTNLGDNISNVDNGWAQNMVGAECYVMDTRQDELVVNTTHDLATGPVYGTFEYLKRTKRRSVASPFGFGLSWDNFTPRQLSILAALGISRGT